LVSGFASHSSLRSCLVSSFRFQVSSYKFFAYSLRPKVYFASGLSPPLGGRGVRAGGFTVSIRSFQVSGFRFQVLSFLLTAFALKFTLRLGSPPLGGRGVRAGGLTVSLCSFQGFLFQVSSFWFQVQVL
jgi:hypothetical protein